MNNGVRRIFVEKRKEFAVEANNLFVEIKEYLDIESLQEVRIVNRYDVEGLKEDEFQSALAIVFSEPTVDLVYQETLPLDIEENAFAIEYLPGQYDQRADSAAQCIQILTQKERPLVKAAKVIVLKGKLTEKEIEKIKNYSINFLDSREAVQEKPEKLSLETVEAQDVADIQNFIDMNNHELMQLHQNMGLAMNFGDLELCQKYFRDIEKRNPSITEIKVIDTYWSDHCRH